MKPIKTFRHFLRTWGTVYLTGFLLLSCIKVYYGKAGSDSLLWLLAPAAWWTKALSGLSFEYVPQIGYVNHSCQFIIAASCSGVQFMILSAAMLIFSFTHWMNTRRQGFLWLGVSLGGSYLYTIFINGIRILLSIRVPLYLQKTGFLRALDGRLDSGQVHTIIGTAVFFSSLFPLYAAAEQAARKISVSPPAKSAQSLYPALWYFAVVLGLPFLSLACRNRLQAFIPYALVICMVCVPVLLLQLLPAVIQKAIHKKIHKK